MRKVVIFFVLLIASMTSHAAELKVTAAKAEIVLPGIAPKDAANMINDAISGWLRSIPMSMRPLPDPLPTRPGRPQEKTVQVQGIDVPFAECPDSFADMFDKGQPTRTQMAMSGDMFRVCVYAFDKGVKAYLLALTYQNHQVLSGLFSGITKAIRGDDTQWAAKRINDIIGRLKEKAPSLLVERIEIPGEPVAQPDAEKVRELIPPVLLVATPQPVTTSPVASAAEPVPTVQGQAAMIEARKELHAMGLVYHNQEQFVAAIRRKDELAARLFVQGGGIDLAAKDAAGKAPVEVAREVGADGIVRLLQRDTSLVPPAAPAAARNASATLMPGQLTPEQQEQMRRQIMMQIRQQM